MDAIRLYETYFIDFVEGFSDRNLIKSAALRNWDFRFSSIFKYFILNNDRDGANDGLERSSGRLLNMRRTLYKTMMNINIILISLF